MPADSPSVIREQRVEGDDTAVPVGQPASPFLLVDRAWYVLAGFNRRASRRQLQRLLRALLACHPPDRILILRPMTPAEVRLLRRYRGDSDAEVFARLACTEDGQLGRPAAQRRRL